MKKKIALLLAVFFVLTVASIPVTAATSRDINEYLTIHYDFEGNDTKTQFADKATAGSSKDNLAFDGTTATALNYYSISNGVITTTGAYDVVPVASANSADLLESNVGNGTWFIRCKTTAATPLIDFRHCAQQSTQNRLFYLALNDAGNIVIEAKSGAAGATHVQTALTYFTYDYGAAPWLNLAAVRKLVDGTYWYYLYVSTGDSPLEPLTTNGSWQVRFSFNATEESGLASAENINMALFNQAFTNWKTIPGVSIDDVRYYNTDLTTAELATVVDSAIAPSVSDPQPTPPAETEPPTEESTDTPQIPDKPETEPPQMETVNPDSGGTPTTPKPVEETTEAPTPTLAFPDDYEREPQASESASTDSEKGCNAATDHGWGIWILFGIVVSLAMKRKKSTN